MEDTPWGGLFCVLTDELVSVGGGLRGSSICKANMAARPLPIYKNSLVIDRPIGFDWRGGSAGDNPRPTIEANFIGMKADSRRGDSRIARPIRCSIFDRRVGSVGYWF